MSACRTPPPFGHGQSKIARAFLLATRARELQAHTIADEILEIADDARGDYVVRNGKTALDHEHVQRARLWIDSRQGLLSKMLPKVYGDQLNVDAALDQRPARECSDAELMMIAVR